MMHSPLMRSPLMRSPVPRPQDLRLDEYSAAEIAAICGPLVGRAWQWMAETDTAVDCYGLARLFYPALGVVIADLRENYDVSASGDSFAQLAMTERLITAQLGAWTQIDRPCFGAAVMLRLSRVSCHIGLFVPGVGSTGGLLHADQDIGRSLIEPIARFEGVGMTKIRGFFVPDALVPRLPHHVQVLSA